MTRSKSGGPGGEALAVIVEHLAAGGVAAIADRLLAGLPYERAVLFTLAAQTRAYELYRKRGWQVLLDWLLVAGLPRPYQVMGLRLAGQGRRTLPEGNLCGDDEGAS